MEIVIVTGMSGAGKSNAIDALEDIGFFCVDNIVPKLIPTFIQLILNSSDKRDRIALVTDIRAGDFFADLFEALADLKKMEMPYKILYIEANDEVLLGRYKLTRRKHPLAERHSGMINAALADERETLLPLRQIADFILDTSYIGAAEFKARIRGLFADNPEKSMRIYCVSFGFKHGIPNDADLVFDVRCLPNPFYLPELKNCTGMDKQVESYVMKWEQSQKLLEHIKELIDYSLPLYKNEGRSQLVIAIGCTGGHHRSVVFAEKLYSHLAEQGYSLVINHRDINR